MTGPATKQYDLIVIGGGPAGIAAATTAGEYGRSVALIDNHPELGGAGANTGTVPSKTLRETALAFSGIQSRNLYGVDLSLRREATVSDFLHHERDVKHGLNHSIKERLRASNAELFEGAACFTDEHTLALGDQSLRGDHILIATGSSPVRPALFPFDQPEIYDSDTILDLDRLPKSMAVIGAGVIGSEYACTFAVLGTELHLLDGRDCLLPFLDAEVSAALQAGMERNGVKFHWKEQVRGCVSPVDGPVCLQLASGGQMTVDAVLVAAGRKSNVETLNLPAAGVHTGDRGVIPVDDYYTTNVPHIMAAGDVIGFPALASTSMDQARRAIRHIFGPNNNNRASGLLPTGVYTIPEVSMVGETEESLKKAGTQYVVGRGLYANSARGRIIGDTDGFLKLLFLRDSMKLVGVHAIGEQATEIVHIGLMALITGSGVDLFDEACFNIPTLGALYKSAALNAMSNATRPAA